MLELPPGWTTHMTPGRSAENRFSRRGRTSAISRRRMRLVRKYIWPFFSYGTRLRLLNMVEGEMHLLRGDTRLRSLPYVVALDPTNVCNLRCPLCPTGQGIHSRPIGKMSLDLYQKVVDQIAARSFKLILHNWGEPLLHPQIPDMVAYASKKRLATEFSTNMNTLRGGLAEDLVRARLTRLVISLDGATQETYRLYRRGGDLERVLDNIAKVRRAREKLGTSFPFLEVQILVMRHNEDELDLIMKKALAAGADHCEFGFTLVNTLDPKQIDRWLPTRNEHLRYDKRDWADRFNSPLQRCSWLWRSLVINWDGTVFPCCNYERKEAELGDLTRMSLQEIWNSPIYQEARRVFKNPQGSLSEGPPKAHQHICAWCQGVPRAFFSDQQGIY